MNWGVRTSLMISAAAFAVSAAAQDAPLPAGPAAESVQEPAQAAANEGDLGDIVVTARRVEERLQDVPISITVFSQTALDNRNITSTADLATYTPSLQANQRFGGANTLFSIRGFTQEARTTSSVGVYFADVVSPRGGNSGTPAGDGAGPGNLFDLQNVQVLKGPQGTLFGRNTTGGAILLVPRKPTGRFEGYIEGSYGNYDLKRLQAVVNLPLSDRARLRLGADVQDRDGYIRNFGGSYVANDGSTVNVARVGPRRFGDQNYHAFRASLVIDLTPDLENYTVASYSKSVDNGPIAALTRCTIDTNISRVPGAGQAACAQFARQQSRGFFSVENKAPDPENRLNQWQVINTTTWRASDQFTIKNISSYSQIYTNLRAELFGTNFFVPSSIILRPGINVPGGSRTGLNFGFSNSDNPPGRFTSAEQENITEELQVQFGSSNNRLTGQAGVYFEKSNPLAPTGSQSPFLLSCTDSDRLQCRDPIGEILSGVLRAPTAIGVSNLTLGETTFRNVGLYAQSTYAILDNLKLTGGIRYTWDKTTADARQVSYQFLQPNVPVSRCTLGASAGLPTRTGVTVDECRSSATQKSDAPTWLVGVDYNPVQDLLLYAKYARGYRQGAANYSAPAEFQTFEPEKVDTYEAGLKATFRGPVPGTFNISGFYNDFTNQQLAVGLIATPGAGRNSTQVIANGGKSRIYGFEVETVLRPFRGFNIDASYGYLNTKLKSLDPVTLPAGYDAFQFAAVAGGPLAFSPKHKVSVTPSYTLPLDDSIGTVSLAATYTYTDDFRILAPPANPAQRADGDFGVIPSVQLLNLNLNWNGIAGSPVDLSLFATNVTNRKYFVSVNDQRSTGFISQAFAMPRMYGARLRYRFGT